MARVTSWHCPSLAALGAVLVVAAGCASSPAPTPAPWASVDGIPGVAGATFAGIAASGGTLVVVGGIPRSGEIGHGAAWRSTDGRTWTQAADDPMFSQRQVVAVAARGSSFIAVGAVCGNGECSGNDAWTSPDGTTWHEAAAMPIVDGITPNTTTAADGGDRWLVGGTAWGRANDPPAPGIWTTTDGSSWSAATVPALPAATSGVVGGFAHSGSKSIAIGSVAPASGSGAAAVWTSTDGATWTRAADDPSFGDSVMNAVVAGGPGFVAVGRDDTGAAVWVSADGSSWQKVSAAASFKGAQMTAVAAANGLLTAAGSNGDGALVWTSTDGRTWVQAPAATTMTGAHAVGVAASAENDFVVGTVPGAAAMWSRGH